MMASSDDSTFQEDTQPLCHGSSSYVEDSSSDKLIVISHAKHSKHSDTISSCKPEDLASQSYTSCQTSGHTDDVNSERSESESRQGHDYSSEFENASALSSSYSESSVGLSKSRSNHVTRSIVDSRNTALSHDSTYSYEDDFSLDAHSSHHMTESMPSSYSDDFPSESGSPESVCSYSTDFTETEENSDYSQSSCRSPAMSSASSICRAGTSPASYHYTSTDFSSSSLDTESSIQKLSVQFAEKMISMLAKPRTNSSAKQTSVFATSNRSTGRSHTQQITGIVYVNVASAALPL